MSEGKTKFSARYKCGGLLELVDSTNPDTLLDYVLKVKRQAFPAQPLLQDCLIIEAWQSPFPFCNADALIGSAIKSAAPLTFGTPGQRCKELVSLCDQACKNQPCEKKLH